jgi:hypothetical protein
MIGWEKASEVMARTVVRTMTQKEMTGSVWLYNGSVVTAHGEGSLVEREPSADHYELREQMLWRVDSGYLVYHHKGSTCCIKISPNLLNDAVAAWSEHRQECCSCRGICVYSPLRCNHGEELFRFMTLVEQSLHHAAPV